jgi:sialidase-1
MSFLKTLLTLLFCAGGMIALVGSSDLLAADSSSKLNSRSVHYATSFESVEASPFSELHIGSAFWAAGPGHAAITDRHSHSGKQSLHLKGGSNRAVTLLLNDRVESGTVLKFQAERWTVRSPYRFSVEAKSGEGWVKIFQGDGEIQVGNSFLSSIECSVPEQTTALRFNNTAPLNAGTLIDDVSIGKSFEMEISHLTLSQSVNPVLLGKEDNPVVHFSVITEGSRNPKALNKVRFSMEGTTDLSDIAAIRIYRDQALFGELTEVTQLMSVSGSLILQEGENSFRISVKLKPEANQDHVIKANLVSVEAHGMNLEVENSDATQAQRIGVALRVAGQDQCHTYRIPGLATSQRGTLIAVYDNRYRSSGDLPGDIDVGMSRSMDGGRHWEPMKVIMDMGNDPAWKFDGIGDPSILVDRQTGRIWVAATWSHGDRSWNGSGPGMQPEETGQFILVHSDDDGLTWSNPVNITKQIKNPDWRFVLAGPGKGISMKDGTLVFPAQFRGPNKAPVNGKPSSTLIYSRDRGETWSIGNGVKIDTTEAQLVELGDGSIMINCRDNRNRGNVDGLSGRTVAVTKDLGVTWQLHETDRIALVEPTCMASLIRIENVEYGSLLIFSNPASQEGRFNMTLKVSDDEGMSWPEKWHALYDARRGAGYSCLTRIDKDRIGVLYEGNRELYFLRFSIAELMKGQP